MFISSRFLLELLSTTSILGAVFGCALSWIAAGACFLYGAHDLTRRDDSSQGDSSQGDSSQGDSPQNDASQTTLSAESATGDTRAARAGWLWIAAALTLQGASALLASIAKGQMPVLFAFCFLAVPLLCGVGLFRLFSPQLEASLSEPTESDRNEDEDEDATLLDEAPNLETQRIAFGMSFLGRATPRARALILNVVDAFIVGASIAVLSEWLWKSPGALNPVRGASSGSGLRDFATMLWLVNAAWIALSFPNLSQSRLSLLLPQNAKPASNPNAPKNAPKIASPNLHLSSALDRMRSRRLRPTWALLLAGSALFGAVSARANANANANGVSLVNILLLLAAALCYGAAAWSLARATAHAANDSQTIAGDTNATGKIGAAVAASARGAQSASIKSASSTGNAESSEARSASTFQVARDFLTLLLPCATVAVGILYVVYVKPPVGVPGNGAIPRNGAVPGNGAFPGNGAVPGNVLMEFRVWCSALLLIGAALRHLLFNWHKNARSSRQSEKLQRRVTQLREEVVWRTQQLTTLHSVSTDLNNTLNHEQVINLALQRLMEAVRADAGAVWMVSNFEQIASDKTGQARGAALNSEEQNRRKNEREAIVSNSSSALSNAAADASPTEESSTRSAVQKTAEVVATRLNLLDELEAEQEKLQSQHKSQNAPETRAPASFSVKTSTLVPETETNKKRLSTAIQNFHDIQNLPAASAPTTPKVSTSSRNTSSPTRFRGVAGGIEKSFADGAADGLLDGDTKARATDTEAATLDVSGHGLRRSRPVHSGGRGANENDDAKNDDTKEDVWQDMEGDGVYVSGPLGDWGTFVASSATASDSSVASNPVTYQVSHTRDTYQTRKDANTEANPTADAQVKSDNTLSESTMSESEVDLAQTSRDNVPNAVDGASDSDAKSESKTEETENGVLDTSGFEHRNWRLVRATGYDTPATNRTLEAMNRALEEGGIVRCARLSASWFGTIGDVHLAPIRWHGDIVGVLSVTSRKRHFQKADRRLLEALAAEVSGALRNSYVYQQARRWAERDSVTNLFNHRAMQEKLGQELVHARNHRSEVTVVMMDLNNFKFFNDTYGHPVGDRVLVTVAQALRESCRTTDIIGRYGGDEFIAVLPDTNASEALEICRRIEECVEGQPFSEGGDEERRIPIGLSFGAAVYPHDGKSSLELLTVADAHLYDAKRGGSALAQIDDTEETQELRKLKDMTVGGSFGVLDALVTAIDNKDNYTRRHSEDVMHWAVLMGRELGYSEDELRAVRVSGLLHDVGKIAVPDAILRKPGRLDDEEFAILQQHPVFGALIVKDVPNQPEVLGGIRHHHERFDGKGYPDNLRGEDIPLLGRLLAVPDCFSAMTTNRPYRKALTWSEALSEIENGSGTQFDPQMAIAFLEVMARIITEQDNLASKNRKKTRVSFAHENNAVAKSENGRTDLKDPAFPSAYAP